MFTRFPSHRNASHFFIFIFLDEKVLKKSQVHTDFNLLGGQNSWLLSNSIIMSIIVLPQVLLSSSSGAGNLQAEFEHRAVSRQFKRPPRAAEGLQSDDGLFP